MTQRTTWASQLGFILSSAGAAVGLGAIWKFPYLAGSNGGAAFFFPYALLTFTVGLALLVAEIALGRSGRGSVVTTYRKLGGRPFTPWAFVAVLSGFGILCFYSAVGGWCIAYFLEAATGGGLIADKAALGAHFQGFVASPAKALGFQWLFLLLCACVVNRDVSRGIERLNKVLLPLFMVLMVIVIARGVTLPGASAGLEYLFSWKPEAFTLESLFAAMGFTFFSLCIGCGCMVTYGSYLADGTNVARSCGWIVFLTFLASVLGGLMIMPAVFAFGLNPAGGPELTFITMPIVFAQLPFGALFASLFYLCLVFAALTSAVSILEITVAYFVDELRLTRMRATALTVVLAAVFGSLCALSFGTLADVKVFGRTFFDLFDFATSNLGLPLGGLVMCALAGVFAWPRVRSELALGSAASTLFRLVLTVASPLVILAVLVTGLI